MNKEKKQSDQVSLYIATKDQKSISNLMILTQFHASTSHYHVFSKYYGQINQY